MLAWTRSYRSLIALSVGAGFKLRHYLNFTPEQRERTKQQYLERNREMAAQRWVEWHTSGKDDDSYIFHLMCRGMGRGEYAALQQHPDLPEIIEAWRQNLKLKRAIEQRKPK